MTQEELDKISQKKNFKQIMSYTLLGLAILKERYEMEKEAYNSIIHTADCALSFMTEVTKKERP